MFSVPLKISFSWKVLIEIVRNVWISKAVHSQLPSPRHHFGVLLFDTECQNWTLAPSDSLRLSFFSIRQSLRVSKTAAIGSSPTVVQPTSPTGSAYGIVHSSTLTTRIIIIAGHCDAVPFDVFCVCKHIYFIRRSFHPIPDRRRPTRAHKCIISMHHLFCETLQIYSRKVLLQCAQSEIVRRDGGHQTTH